MKPVYPNCAGLDVHKKFVVACRLVTNAAGETARDIGRFSTMTTDLESLAAWLADGACTHVVMESTGVFWQPVYNVLEARFEVLLANPQHLPKHVPGRKTDVKDAAWLAELLQYGLIRASFIPDRQQRELRDLVRYRLTLVDERTRVVNRLQKVLEDANIKLSAVATDLQGVSAQAMLAALLAGEEDPAVLADLARGRLRSKRAQLEQAFVGRMRAHHRFMLGELLEQLEFVDEKIGKVESRIAEMLAQMPEFEHAVAELDAIPGVERQAAVAIVAEIGVDMSRFPSDRHITAWAGVAPGNNETGGKSRAAPARKGNKYLRRVLIQCGHGAGRTKRSYLGSMYGRLAARRGKQRAAVATGRTILQIVYHMLNRGTSYADLGPHYFELLDKERATKRHIRQLQLLGYDVQVTERPAA